ncbi:MAG: 30S ribosomal protein S13 [Thermoprotei archaeon]|nr:MAG: 30S ribosomal protein S13 [Thermoprotei archaeon]RLE89242.1 MAG: 30S ribosomal protein S13 [Thermoprotei archaeon]
MSRELKYIVRIADKDLPGDKRLAYALALIKGIGINTAIALCRKLGLDPSIKLGTLSDSEIKKLDSTVRKLHELGLPAWILNRPKDPETGRNLHYIGSELILRAKMDIDLLKRIKCWRGIRHALGLKVRGQRTRTTGRTGMTVGVTRRRK